MQLRVAIAAGLAGLFVWSHAASPAAADDRFDFTTTWYQERRRGQKGLTIIHPQLDFGVDIGESTSLGLGYSADVVTGATAAVYNVDATTAATEFDDLRHEGRLSLGFGGSRSRLTFTGGIANERDYLSFQAGANASIDLPGKNTNIGLSYSHNFDEVCDRDNSEVISTLERIALTGFDECRKKRGVLGRDTPGMTVWHDLSIDTVQATVTQNVTPTLVGQLSLYGQVLRGFQANPYRRVRVLGNEPQEVLPEVRGRAAITARVNKYLESLRGAMHGSVRGYSDTWGVNSLSAELAYSQYAGKSLLFRFRTRLHQQTEAEFFKDAFFYEVEGPARAFFTGDRELAPVRNILVGAKLSFISVGADGENVLGLFDEVLFNMKGDLLFLDELPANSLSDNRDGIDAQFLSSDQLMDAFILQVGILASY